MIIQVGDQRVDITAMLDQGWKLAHVRNGSITFWRPTPGQDYETARAEARKSDTDNPEEQETPPCGN